MQASGNSTVDNSPQSSQATRGKSRRRLPRAFAISRRALQLWLGKLKMRILTIVICLRPHEKIWPSYRSEVAHSVPEEQQQPSSPTEKSLSGEVVQPQPAVSPESPRASNAGGNIVKNDSERGVTVSVADPRGERPVVQSSILQGYPDDNRSCDCLPRVKRNKYPAASSRQEEDVTVSCLQCCRKPDGSGVDLEQEVNRLLREEKARGRVNNLTAWKKEDRERAKRVAARCRTSLGLYSIRDLGQNIDHSLDAYVWARPEVMLYDFDTSTHAYISSCYAKRPNLHLAMQKPILEDESMWRNSLRAYNKIRKKTSAHNYQFSAGTEGHLLPTRIEGPAAAEGSSKLSRRGRPTIEHQEKTKRFGTPVSQLYRQQQTASRTGKYDGTGPIRPGNFHNVDRDPSPSSPSFQSQLRYPVREVHDKHWNLPYPESFSGASSPRHGDVHFQRGTPDLDGVHDKVDLDTRSAKPVSDAKCKHQPATKRLLSPVKKPLREGKWKQSLEKPIAKRIVFRASKRGGTPDITLKKLYLVSDNPRNKVKARRLSKARAQQKPKRLSVQQIGTKRQESVARSKKEESSNEEDLASLVKEKRAESSESGKFNRGKSPGIEDLQVTLERFEQKQPGEDKFMPYDLDAVAAQLKDEPIIVLNVNSSRNSMGSIIDKCCGDGESKESQAPEEDAISQRSEEPNLSKDTGSANDTQPAKTPSSKSSATGTGSDHEESNLYMSEDTEAKVTLPPKSPSSMSSETVTDQREAFEEIDSSVDREVEDTVTLSSKFSVTSMEQTEESEETNLSGDTEAKDTLPQTTPFSMSSEIDTESMEGSEETNSSIDRDTEAKDTLLPVTLSSKSSVTSMEQTEESEETNLSGDTEAKDTLPPTTPFSMSSEIDTESMEGSEENNSSIDRDTEAKDTLPPKALSSKSSAAGTESREGSEDTNLSNVTEASLKDTQLPKTPSRQSSETGMELIRASEENSSSNYRELIDTEPRKTPTRNYSETGRPHSGKTSSTVTGEKMDTTRNAPSGNKEARSFPGGSYSRSSFLGGELAYAESLEKSTSEPPTQPSELTLKKPEMKDESIQVNLLPEKELYLQRQVPVETQSRATSALRPSRKDEQTQFSSRSAVAEQENLGPFLRPVARPSMNDNGIPFSKPGLYQVLEPPHDAFGGKVLATSLTKRASVTEDTSSQKPSSDDHEFPSGITSPGTSPSPERTMSFSSSTSDVSSDLPYTSEEMQSPDRTGDIQSSHGRLSRHDLKPRVIVRSSLLHGGREGFSLGNQSRKSSRVLDGIEDADLEGATGRKRSSGIRIHSFLKSMAQRSRSVELNNLILEELARKNPGLMEKLGYNKEHPDSEERKSSLSTMSSAPENPNDAGEGNHPGTSPSDMSDRYVTRLSTFEDTSSVDRESVDDAAEQMSFHGTGRTVGPTLDASKSPDRLGNFDRESVTEIPPTSDQRSEGSVSGSLLSERSYLLSEELFAKTPEDEDERNRSSVSSYNWEDSGGGRMPTRGSRVIMRSSIILGGIKDFGTGNRTVRSSRILDVSGIEDSDLERFHRKRSSNVRIHSFLHSMTHRTKSVQLNNLILQELAKNPGLRDRITLQSDSEDLERKSSLSAMSSSLDSANEGNGNDEITAATDMSRRPSESPSVSLSWMDGESRTPSLSSGPLLDAETFADQILSLSIAEDSDLHHLAGESQTPGAFVPTEVSKRMGADPQTHLQDPLVEQARSPRHGKIHSIFKSMMSERAESGESEEVTRGTKQEHRSGQLETRNIDSPSSSGNQGPSLGPENLISSHLDGDRQGSQQRSATSESQIENSSLVSRQESTSQADEMNSDRDASRTSSNTAASQNLEEIGSLALSAHQLIASSQQSSEFKPPLWMERWKSDRFADFPPAPLPSVSRNDGEDSPPPTPSSGPPSTPPHQVEFLQAFWNKN